MSAHDDVFDGAVTTKRRGRPPSSAEEKAKSRRHQRRLELQLFPKERAKVKADAEAAGLNMQAYCRMKLGLS